MWSAVLLLVILAGPSQARFVEVDDTLSLGIVVKRDVDGVDPGTGDSSTTPASTTVFGSKEAEVSSTVAGTSGSLLDIFSTSSKERKPASALVQSLHINSNVTFRYAKTRVESKVTNPAEEAQEVVFSVIIPETAFISGFSMEIDEKVYTAYVKEKQEAQKVYDAAVKQGVTAGHVKQSARDSNRFLVSVNVEPQKKVRFNLTYEELLERINGVYRHVINISPGQIVPDLKVDILINENREITLLKVPAFQSGNEINPDLESQDFKLSHIERISPKEAKISFKPTVEEQNSLKKPGSSEVPDGLSGQFAVEYDVKRDPSGGEILVNNGYFVHFFAPPDLKPLKKHVIFVLDVSGSMIGRKIEQLKEAMNSILSELNPMDYFNIIPFSYDATVSDLDATFSPVQENIGFTPPSMNTTKNLRSFPASPHYVEKGKEAIKKMIAGGGTNIYDALDTAIDVAIYNMNSEIGKQPSAEVAAQGESTKYVPPEPIIVFLTDGEPTVGHTSERKILQNVDEKNKVFQIPIFSLAFGKDADMRLLKRISLLNSAFARQIYEAADTSLQLRNFYKQISSPTLASVKFVYPPEEVEDETVTKVNFPNFYCGSELVVAGRLKDDKLESNTGVVEGRSVDGVHNYSVTHIDFIPPMLKAKHSYHPLERLWVYMTIKQLLNEAELMKARSYMNDYKEEPKPLKPRPEEKALRLALQYFSYDLVYVDTKPKEKSKNLSETITDLAVQPGFTVDANIESASSEADRSQMSSPLALGYVPSPFTASIGSAGQAAAFPAALGGYRPMSKMGVVHDSMVHESMVFNRTPDNLFASTTRALLTLKSITWLEQSLNSTEFLHFTLSGNATELRLGRNQANDAFGSCSTGAGVAGICRHLEHCVKPEIIWNIDAYINDFLCVIPGDYAGICCT